MIIFSKRVAEAIKSVIPCNRIAVAILGLEVPHAISICTLWIQWRILTFKRPKLQFTPEEFKETAAKSAGKSFYNSVETQCIGLYTHR